MGLDPSPESSSRWRAGRRAQLRFRLISSRVRPKRFRWRTERRHRGHDLNIVKIPDASRSLHEMRRVLKPTGRLLFVEHGRVLRTQRAPGAEIASRQFGSVSAAAVILIARLER